MPRTAKTKKKPADTPLLEKLPKCPPAEPTELGLLPPKVLVCLAQLGKGADKVRERLPIGDGQRVRFTLDVDGAINVGGPSTANVHVEPPAKDLLTIVLGSLGPKTREAAVKAVVDACQAFLAGEGDPVVTEAAKDLAEDLLTRVRRPHLQKKRGAITASLKATLVPAKG